MLINDPSVFVLPLDFGCTVLNDNQLLANVYRINLGANPIEEQIENLGLGFQKIKYLTEFLLNDSIILEKSSPLLETLDTLDNNLVCLPCEPYDVYVGSILMKKFQAITENYFDIQYLSISSMLGGNVQFNLLSPYDSDLDIDGDHWWNSDSINTGSKSSITWNDLSLTEVPKFRPTVIKGGLSEN